MPAPFFIVGTGRSGTTMFRKLIAHHPRVHVPRETHFLPILFHSFGLREVPAEEIFDAIEQVYMAKGDSVLDRIHRQRKADGATFRSVVLAGLPGSCTIRRFMDRFYQALAEEREATHCGDKTPDYGMCMGIVRQIWPDARFVHIVRDGRDVALSMREVLSFRILAAAGINHWWALAWKKSYERFLDAAAGEIPLERFFELWRSRLLRARDEASRLPEDAVMEIDYAEILRDAQGALARASGFLSLPDERGWIERAAAKVRNDNLDRNAALPEYRALTDRYARDLAEMGFPS